MKRVVIGFVAIMSVAVGSSVFAATELAKVNGKSITDKELTLALGGLNEGQKDSFLKDPNSKRELLMKLVDQEILSQEAEKAKLDQDQEFKDTLAFFRKQYLVNRVLEKNLGAKMTDKAAKKYYEAHKNLFSTDGVHVQHILAADEAGAKEIIKKAKAPNADFQELAEKLSKDPSAKNNRGDLGFIMHDSPFVKEFKDAAFEGAEGDIIGPVKTVYGYHVLKIVQKRMGKPLEYDEVELKVKQQMREDLVGAYVSKLKDTAKIQIDEKALGAVKK
jgi:parvulin-like peptidyl-prolyl isomerase